MAPKRATGGPQTESEETKNRGSPWVFDGLLLASSGRRQLKTAQEDFTTAEGAPKTAPRRPRMASC
eukprot:5895164-Pyramimonas_sp.AAC.1